MKFKILISEDAENQILEAILYYKNISVSLSKKFSKEISETVELISENPQHYQNRYKEIKIAFTNKFPYSLHFIIKNDTIYILKMLHQKQFYK